MAKKFPTPIKPELVDVGDMIEVCWESEGIYYSVRAYVGSREELGNIDLFATNGKTRLLQYNAKGTTYPSRGAQVYRHRMAPRNEDMF